MLSSLYVLGSGTFQHVGSNAAFLQISQSTVSRNLWKFIEAVHKILPQHISFPSTHLELLKIKQDFFEESGFPNCVGALDCTHIYIVKPVERDFLVFLNRKNRFSINVQMVSKVSDT